MRDLSRAATETASSDVIPSVSKGLVLSLTETEDTDHLGLFSMPEFDFLSDLDRHLRASSPNGGHDQESFLPANQLLSLLCLFQLTTQNQSHMFLHLPHLPNQLLQGIPQSTFLHIFSTKVNHPLPPISQII